MDARTLLCVEPDEGAVEQIRSALEPYGFEVQSIPNGEAAVDWARHNEPSLIIVSVEPRKVGYAVCNKLKRANELQRIPLILTSAEETPQTFDQHKKLKSRADEYLLKPFTADELLAKVGTLIHLQDPEATNRANGNSFRMGESLLGADISQELSVGDSDIMDEATAANKSGSTSGNPFARGNIFDAAFDQEADAAFAAIQSPGETAPLRTGAAAAATGPSEWDDEKTSTTFMTEADFSTHAGAASPGAVPSPSHFALFPTDAEVPQPEEVSVTSSLADPSLLDGKITDLNARIQTLEADRAGLLEQIDELKHRLQSAPLSKEKEFLSLRETINRKEKDILDLRDALDAKDRQMLDQKDRVREHERARRDLEERTIDFEKSLMAAQERSAALAHDKDKASEREKGLKARLDDAITEIAKTHDEADSLKRRLAQTEDRVRTEFDKVRVDLESRLRESDEHHRTEVARLSEERVALEEDLKSEFEAELSKSRSAHASELEGHQKRFSEEQKALEERLDSELGRLRREHDKALGAARDELGQQLTAERQAHQEALEAKEQNHKVELQGLRRRLEDDITSAEERRQRELVEAENKRQAELEAAEARRRSELQSREEEHHGKLAELDRLHFNEKTELGERHRQDLDQAHARSARAEGELAARLEELGETQRRLAALETDRDSLRGDLRDREVKLAQLRDRGAELEAKSAEYEDQILRAYQKLRSDEKVVDRAKRALAVALQLLDERAGPAPQTAPGTGSGPTAAKPSDEPTG
jgi:DNA-binding response OmpR family regulator/predicted  nucleic acid-binding Zn-ribbon protein